MCHSDAAIDADISSDASLRLEAILLHQSTHLAVCSVRCAVRCAPTNHQETALQSLLLQHRQGCAQRSIGGTAQGSQLLG